MSKSAEYRSRAAKYRREAETAEEPSERDRILKAAEKWDAIADEAELTERQLDQGCPDWGL